MSKEHQLSERATARDVEQLFRSFGKEPDPQVQQILLLRLEKERGAFVKNRQFAAAREQARQREITHPRERGHDRGR